MNYIFFQTDTADDSGCYPITAIRGFKQTGEKTITIFLTPIKVTSIVKTKDTDKVAVKFNTAATMKNRFEELAAFVNQPASAREDGFLVLGNDLTNKSFTQESEFDEMGSYTITTGS